MGRDDQRRADRRPRRRGWALPLALLVITFVVPSMRGGAVVGSEQVTELVQSVLMKPWSESVPILMPVAKLALLVVAVMGITGKGPYAKVLLAYYATILGVVAIFQNTATLPEGVAVIVGNLLAQLVVAAVCLLGIRGTLDTASLRRERLWMLPLMLWAWLYPFAVQGNTIVPGGWTGVFVNSAGVTYCMVTPVVAGTMALRPAAYGRTTRVVVGWLGLIFGLLNLLTWFVVRPASWWMGTLHVPLLVITAVLTITSWREPRESSGVGVGVGEGGADGAHARAAEA